LLTKRELDEHLVPWLNVDRTAERAADGQTREGQSGFSREGRVEAGAQNCFASHDLDAKRDGEEITPGLPVGIVILMENAVGVREPAELEMWRQRGMRIIGPAHFGANRFCGATNSPGPLTGEGYALLDSMGRLGFTLDLSHMDEEAAIQALEVYKGPVIASHGNVQALLKGVETNRHLTDAVIRGILERDGVIGVVPYNPFLQSGWKLADGRKNISLERFVAHIDYICQMAGNARHAGIGSDFEGGFGVQSVPEGIDTIADLQIIAPLLLEKGYSPEDVSAILGGNWVAYLRKALPDNV
jgi:membrane dipeptidase